MEEDGRERVVDGRGEVGVGEDNVGVLAAQLERDLLHRGGGVGHDAPTRDDTTGEGHHVDSRMGSERCACSATRPEDEIAHACRETGLLEETHEMNRGARRQLARLQHEGASGRECGSDLPGCLEERVVPRSDESTHADGRIVDARAHIRVARIDDTAAECVALSEARKITERLRHISDVVLGLDQALAGVEGLQTGDDVDIALEEIRDTGEQPAPLGDGDARPATMVECRTCGEDGALGVDSRRLIDDADDLPVSRASDLARAALGGRDPGTVDVEIRHRPSLPRHGGRRARARGPVGSRP